MLRVYAHTSIQRRSIRICSGQEHDSHLTRPTVLIKISGFESPAGHLVQLTVTYVHN